MHRLLEAHVASLGVNTRLFLNCLHGISDRDAVRRTEGPGNSISFIAVHLIDARHFLARALGSTAAYPLGENLEGARSIEDVDELPSLSKIQAIWSDVTEDLVHRLDALSEADLAKPAEQKYPTDDESTLGGIAFLLHHESYHLGQLGLLRKQLGHPAMSYGEPTAENGQSHDS